MYKSYTEYDLKPCPFCGSKDDLIVDHLAGTISKPAYRILCDNCGASARYSDNGDHKEIWNTRYE